MRFCPFNCRLLVALAVVTLLCDLPCQASPPGVGSQPDSRIDQICPLVESVARANTLPVDFFVRLIWRESRFRPDVMGPVTANGQRAEGIAQFMPATAAEHNLTEPFNPSAALPKSGEFLAKLRDQFGSLGLAAAAYNAGAQRVRDYLSGSKSLPAETRNYVFATTGHAVEEWTKPASPPLNKAISAQAVVTTPEAARDDEPVPTCRDLIAHFDQAPSHLPLLRQSNLPFEWRTSSISVERQTKSVIRETPQRVLSWCSGLRHPDTSECGDVRMREQATKTAGSVAAHGRLHPFTSRVHLPRVSVR